jgi:hypothetical protein
MSVNFSADPATRAWLATLPGMGDTFADNGPVAPRSKAPATGLAAGDATAADDAGANGGTASAELSFWDLLDVVNPLQHIPIVNHIYRAITGDTIRPPAQIIGSTLFGGPLGFAVATATTVIDEANGEPVATSIARALGVDQPRTNVAAVEPDQASPPAPQPLASPVGTAGPLVAPPASPVASSAPGAIVPKASEPAASALAAARPAVSPATPPAAAPAAVVADASAAAIAPAAGRGPTDFFTRLQNPGGSKAIRPLVPVSAPPSSIGQTGNAASTPGSFRPTRIPAYVDPAAAPAVDPAAETAANALAALTPGLTPAPAPAQSAPVVARPQAARTPTPPAPTTASPAPVRMVSADAASPPTPANSDAGRKPNRDEVASQMMRALERYQASQKIGDRRVTPVAGGLF